MSPITVSTTVNAPIEHVWKCWTEPEHIIQWAFASDDWHAPEAENDLRVGGSFKTVMAAKDGSAGFDFTGTYSAIATNELIEYKMDDGRAVSIQFAETRDGVQISETFDPEQENPVAMQRAGWQAILDNFKQHAETSA